MELKPCPFCGMNARAWSESQSWYVGCIGAFCAAQTKPFCEREEAIEAWNTRAERTCMDIAMQDDKFRCSLCNYECRCAKGSSFDFSGLPWLSYCPNCGAKVVEA